MPADCEFPTGWWFDQPVNTWSSLAFVIVGVAIAAVTVRRGASRWFWLLALATVVEGVGSVLYHGNSTRGGHFVHDLGLFAMAAFFASWQLGRLVGDRWTGGGVGMALAVSVPAWWISTASTNVTVAVLVVAIVGTELAARRRGLPGIWTIGLVALTGLAVVFWGLGHSESPLCEPESPLQPHAVWHVLSALVVLRWFDRALDVEDPATSPRLFRRGVDRIIGLVATALVRTFHRSVETLGPSLPTGRPVLVVANHGNGFVDPVVVAAALGRLPRFLAKAALWKVAVARPFLDGAGALPVYRRSDGDDVSNNRSVFAACHDELARSATVAVFPEGTTGDRAGLDRVRSGAARIALGSVDDAPDLVIVPIGLAFETRYQTRSRVVVVFGDPIEVAPFRRHGDGDDGEPAHDDVRALTDEITAALEAVSPEFHSVDERDSFRATGRIVRAAQTGRADPSFAASEMIARDIAAAPEHDRRDVMEAFDAYARRLTAAELVDRDVASRVTPVWRLALSVLALVFGGSLVVSATIVHLPAIVLVVAATSAVHATATKGTVRALVGAVTGLATWLIAGVVIADGWAALGAAALVALGGVAALLVWTPLVDATRTVVGRLRCRARGSGLEELFRARSELASLVAGVTASDRHDTSVGS